MTAETFFLNFSFAALRMTAETFFLNLFLRRAG
jgi:hypothetical protein